MFDVITIGSATRDVLIKSEDFTVFEDKNSKTGKMECLPLGSKIEIKELFFASGGGGTNSAVTFARQGFNTACIGVIGKDPIGQDIIDELKRENVDTSFFQTHTDDRTAYSLILVHPSGERTILSYKGEGQHFDVHQIAFDKLETGWFYLDSMGGNYDLFASAVDYATKHTVKIASNPGGKELKHGLEKLKPLLAQIDIYITNKEEGAELLGIDLNDWEGIAKGLRQHVKGIVSVSDGPKGVIVIDDHGTIYQARVPDSPVVERTGAGDAFGSGFVAEYVRSSDIEKAIQFGTANASSVVTKFGGKSGILKGGDWGPWSLVEVFKK